MRKRKLALATLLPLVAAAWQIQPSAFHISIIDGEGALNNVQGRLAREPVVQVEDRNRKPVAGAYVVFASPNTGPGAIFADGTNHFSVTTGVDGRAAASGMRPNGINGSFNLEVHVSLNGQEIGHVTIHQANVPAKLAHLSNNLQETNTTQVSNVAAVAGVLGVAVGGEFLIDGAPIHGNGNLQVGTQLRTEATPVGLHLQNGGEFLVGPNSSVQLGQPNLLTVETGAARARQFGKWRMGHGGVWLTAQSDNADGVMSVTQRSIEVACINGTVEVLSGSGAVLQTLAAGTAATFGATAGISGAGVAAATGLSTGQVALIGAGAAALLIGLGVAADVNTPPPPTSP